MLYACQCTLQKHFGLHAGRTQFTQLKNFSRSKCKTFAHAGTLETHSSVLKVLKVQKLESCSVRMTITKTLPQLFNNCLLTYDSYVPLYNRFHRGECIKWHERSECHLGPGLSRAPSPPLTQVIHSPYEIYYTGAHKNHRSIKSYNICERFVSVWGVYFCIFPFCIYTRAHGYPLAMRQGLLNYQIFE